MKTRAFFVSAALSAATVTGVAAPATAAAGGNEALQFCSSIAQFYPDPQRVIGPCTSYFTSHNSNAAATIVYFCSEFFVPAGEFATLGECVTTLGRAAST